jgi:AraC-like DNA-binding protein
LSNSAAGRELELSETGCADARRALLVSWGPRALYVGPGFNLSPHRNSVAVLAAGLDGPLDVATNPRDPDTDFRRCRTALIEPNQLHYLRITGSACAFLYVDALSRDLASLRGRCRSPGLAVSTCLEGEAELIELLATMPRSVPGWQDASPRLAALLRLERACRDERIATAVETLLSARASDTATAALAVQAGLSLSRFQHVFKATTGVPVRRFRLWARMRRAIALAVGGSSLTHAALEAGFSSQAHFTAAFREMFGMAPSQLLAGTPLFIEARESWLGRPSMTAEALGTSWATER